MRIAIIPARGGSKRIPRKNIRLFKGMPIIFYAIQVAQHSKLFDRIIVSTDDQEIADTAESFGAEIPFLRSKEASDDYSTLYDVAKEVIINLNLNIKNLDVAIILPTAPLLTVSTVKKCLHNLENDEFDSALTVTEFEVNPKRALEIGSNGCIVKCFSSDIRYRSQDHKILYHDAGQMYAFSAKEMLGRETITSSKSKAVVLKRLECQDIDSEDDWFLAEVKYSRLKVDHV